MTQIIFLIFFIFSFINVPKTHALQATFGDCSPIINTDNLSKKDIQKFVEKGSPKISIEADRIVFIIDCSQYIDNPQKRLEILLISLKTMLSIKERLVYPAIEIYKSDPSDLNWKELKHRTYDMLGYVDNAIVKAVELEAQISVLKAQDKEKLVQKFRNLDHFTYLLNNRLRRKLFFKSVGPRKLPPFQDWNDDAKFRFMRWEEEYKDTLRQLSLITDELQSHLQK